ncbi:MAG: hypothetical protein CO022_10065, partial [Flavobacteriales bacterium CG_4_9_14_0_2_um_filter_32_27]
MEQDKNKRLDELFKQAKNEPSKVSFEETKGQFLSSVGNQHVATKGIDIAKLFNLKLIIMITSIIATVALVLVLKPTNTTKAIEKVNINYSTPTKLVVANEKQVLQEQQQVITEYLRKVDRITPDGLALNQEKEQILLIPADSLKRYKKLLVQSARITELLDTAYQFPILTPEEILANNKQKVKMFGKKKQQKVKNGQWYQPDPEGFLFIPMDTTKRTHAFYIKRTEVSNLEYRTFLFDLLIQNRKEEFLKAKPDQAMWVKEYPNAFNQPMQDNYFSHPAYNDYPVVAISREGAELFCKWMTEELNVMFNLNLVNNFRLPSSDEWEFAAKGGLVNQPYPWGGPYLRNSKGCFLANFYPIKDNYTADGSLHTAKVDSYNPNDYGLYCMSGNVAEMVYYEDENNLPGTRGGSWSSIGQELQIVEGNDRFKGRTEPSVNVGFRPVMTYLGRANAQINPSGTVKIKGNIYIDKTEVSNFDWREYVMWLEKTYGKTAMEYRNALPDTLVWKEKESFNEPYTQYYYSHPAYNDYPVVGISYEQAVQYCKWRTERVKELFETKMLTDKKNVYPTNFEYRLPTKEEWEAAAKIGYSEKIQQQL